MNTKQINKQIEKNRKIIKSWPRWMQELKLSAHTFETGQFKENVK